MRIALVSEWDTSDPAAWSGVVHPMARSLEKLMDVQMIHLQAPHHPLDRFMARSHGAVGKTYLPGQAVASARRLGRQLQASVRDKSVHAVLAIAASSAVATAKVDVPVVHVTDATLHAISNYYPLFTGLGQLSRAQAEWLERRSQRRTAHVVTSSRWARTSFVDHYGFPAERVSVVPFGPAIIPDFSLNRSGREMRANGLRALVVASSWERKGGDRAVAAVARLRDRGIDASLSVVGNCPAGLPGWVRPLGRLSREKVSAVYLEHDVLLELARANAGGVTLTDAAVHGLPVVATDTGGVPDIVRHGHSGYLIRSEQDEDSSLFALTDPGVRQQLSAGALQQHRQVLNWDVWSKSVHAVLRDLTAGYGRGRTGETPPA